ncbi:MAG: hypothetical protein V4574_16060 [Pseudomonadota bacterium]
MRSALALAMLAALAGCATTPRYPPPAQVYRNPSAFMGKTVRLCGYAQQISNFSEKPDGGTGFSLDGEARRLGDYWKAGINRVCLRGTVGYVGCADGEEICSGWMYNFILYVDDVRPW